MTCGLSTLLGRCFIWRWKGFLKLQAVALLSGLKRSNLHYWCCGITMNVPSPPFLCLPSHLRDPLFSANSHICDIAVVQEAAGGKECGHVDTPPEESLLGSQIEILRAVFESHIQRGGAHDRVAREHLLEEEVPEMSYWASSSPHRWPRNDLREGLAHQTIYSAQLSSKWWAREHLPDRHESTRQLARVRSRSIFPDHTGSTI